MSLRTFLWMLPVVAAGCLCSCKDLGGDATGPRLGTGGSMARFAIKDNSLYIASKESLEIYDITEPANPVKGTPRKLGFGVETIFPYQDKLFLGASDGMHIFDNSNTKSPVFMTTYRHIQSCDPVVVQGNYAYVTLRGGAACRVGISQSSLDVVDVSNPASPFMVHTQAVQNPYGLGVSGKTLFVCEGTGLKTFDLTDPRKPVLLHHFSDIPAYDVIIRNPQSLIVTGSSGLLQYRFSNGKKMELLSRIPVL